MHVVLLHACVVQRYVHLTMYGGHGARARNNKSTGTQICRFQASALEHAHMWVIECVSFMPAACLGLQRTEDCVNIPVSTGSGSLLWITVAFEPLVVLGPVLAQWYEG